MSAVTFPPEPWYLGGSLLVSAFLVSPVDLPAGLLETLPAGRRPLRLGRRVLVGVAAVRYLPGGVLAYDELLVALPSRGRGGLRVTIPQIWVDSPESRAGGRELWGIPKELGRFERGEGPEGVTATMIDAATVTARVGRRLLPGLRQVPLPTLQHLDGRTIDSRNLVVGRLSALRASWVFSGPLAYLAGRRPFLSVAISDAAVIFGMDVKRDR